MVSAIHQFKSVILIYIYLLLLEPPSLDIIFKPLSGHIKNSYVLSSWDFTLFLVMLMIIVHTGKKKKRICSSTYETNKDTAHAYIFPVQIPENKKYHVYFQQHLALPPVSCGLGSVIWYFEKEMATHSSILAWKNYMDRGAWWAIVHGVAKIRVSTCQWIWY